jgi:predicted Zn-dependent peptidase
MRWPRILSSLLLAGLCAPPRAGAQERAYRFTAIEARPGATVTALSFALPTGSHQDPPGQEGSAWLLGRTLSLEIGRSLAPGGFDLSVRVGSATTTVTVLVPPERRLAALRAVDSVLFATSISQEAVTRARADALAALAFESGAPGAEFEAATVAMLGRDDPTWGRPLRGNAAALAQVDRSGLERFRRDHYLRSATAFAAVGVVDPTIAPRELGGARPKEPLAPPWQSTDRTILIRDVTSSWISVAYPVAPGVARTPLEFVAHLLREQLHHDPPDPDLFEASVSIEEVPAGRALVVRATVTPEASERWEATILGTVRSLAERHTGADGFRWGRRRFRSERLTSEDAPEAVARRVASDLLRDGFARALRAEIWALDPDALAEAVAGLGPPRIVVLGPDLGAARERGG